MLFGDSADGDGDEMGSPSRAGQLLTLASTLQAAGSSKPFVTLRPAVAGSPLFTSFRIWHKHTGLLRCTSESVEQQAAVGFVTLEATYSKQEESSLNSFEQSTFIPLGPAEVGGTVGGVATGACTGVGVGGNPRRPGHLLGSTATPQADGIWFALTGFPGAVAGSLNVCCSWQRQTGNLASVVLKAEQHCVEGALTALLLTKSKHGARLLNWVLQSVSALAVAVHQISAIATATIDLVKSLMIAILAAAVDLTELAPRPVPSGLLQ